MATLGIMTKIRIAILCGAVFVVGLLVGGGAVGWFYSELLLMRPLALEAAVGVMDKVTVLESLRAGDSPNAFTRLEDMLNLDLLKLGHVPESSIAIDTRVARMIGRAADYRTKYPYKTGVPGVDSPVSEVLSKYRVAKDQEK